MPTCILHVGMPKTGTSSIQDSLCFGLEDSRFRYLALGRSNAVEYLEPIFGDDGDRHWLHRRKGYSPATIARLRRRFAGQFRRALRRARASGATPIVSAERCWNASPAYLGRLRDFIAEEGFETRVIVYLRPFVAWYASAFQQLVKFDQVPLDFSRICEQVRESGRFEYVRRLEGLERVFGRDRLEVRLFSRRSLVDGCAVRDFCTALGIGLDSSRIVRTNDSLSVDAIRMLYSCNRLGGGLSRLSFFHNHLLVMRLQQLPGGPVRFHPSVLAPLADEIAREEREVLARYGVDLRDSAAPTGGAACLSDASDLFRFPRSSLDWLARSSGLPPIAGCEGEDVAREVVRQVLALAMRPDPRLRIEFLRYRLRIRLRYLVHGH